MGKERIMSGQSPKSLRNNPSSNGNFFFFGQRGTSRNSIGFGEHPCASSFRFLNKNVHIHT